MRMAIVCSAMLGLLVFLLGFAVSMVRGRAQVVIGYPDDPANLLHKLVRAHGNAAEYAPIIAILMLIIGMQGAAPWMLWTMAGITAFRYLHAAGMILPPPLDQVAPLRFIGALGTYLGGLALVVAALIA